MLIVANSQADSRVDTEANLQSSVRNLSMPVYIIDIPSSASTPNSNEKALLKELASGTGGGYFGLEKAEDFPEALRKVQASLRSVYFVGYRPQNTARDGSYRTVEVSVPAPRGVPAKLTVLSRPGYNTPSQ